MKYNPFAIKDIVHLDETDMKILKVLYQNARAPIKEISKKSRVQRDVVKYRIDKMLKNNVIRFFTPVLNPATFGFPIFTWMNFIFQSFDATEQSKFQKYLMMHENVAYISKVSGKYNYMIGIGARNLQHLDEIISSIIEKFSHLIKEYNTSSIINETKYDNMIGMVNQQIKI